MLADLVTVINLPVKKSTVEMGGGVNQLVVLVLSPNLPVRIYAGRFLESANLLTDLVTVTKSASQKICWKKWRRGKSVGRSSVSHQICKSGNLLEEMGEESSGRYSDSHQICQSGKYARRKGRAICQQI